MLPRPVIEAFDQWLKAEALTLEAIVIGGAALALLGVITRQTKDFDILAPELSSEILAAARAFAAHQKASGDILDDDWLNNGPMSLIDLLPDGWRARTQVVFQGEALTLMTLGRSDLIKTKLFALCDRGTDLNDCIALSPSKEEIAAAELWVIEQDGHAMWPAHVRATLSNLEERLGYGV
jgi:hypothetical protein